MIHVFKLFHLIPTWGEFIKTYKNKERTSTTQTFQEQNTKTGMLTAQNNPKSENAKLIGAVWTSGVNCGCGGCASTVIASLILQPCFSTSIQGCLQIPSGKLTLVRLWKIILVHGNTHYFDKAIFNGHVNHYQRVSNYWLLDSNIPQNMPESVRRDLPPGWDQKAGSLPVTSQIHPRTPNVASMPWASHHIL